MKKKGFTLIELLAVIIILAIILVIAVPKILEVIENARMQSYKESVQLMVHTAKLQYETQEIQGTAPEIPADGLIYRYGKDGNDTIQTNINEVGLLNFKGDKPSSGTITLLDGKKVQVENLISKDGRYCAKKEKEGKVDVGRTSDSTFNCSLDSSSSSDIIDLTPCELETETIDGKEVYYIDSVEDMYAFSYNVNSGNSYEGKIVKLRVNLDFSGYSKEAKPSVCPQNGNDNENGFTPIGTFAGTFDGGAKTISNLTIDRPSEADVGIFREISGTVLGLTLDNIKVSAGGQWGSYAGTLAGENSGTIKEVVVKNSEVSATNTRYGGITGYSSQGTKIKSVLVKSVKLTGYDTASSGPVYGELYNAPVLDGAIVENSDIRGTKTTLDQINNLNYYEKNSIDTWINGDNDNSGYYFDFENSSSNDIVLKSVKTDPIPTSLDSTFTKSGNYYLISNANDWKNFTAFDKTRGKFKLANDLDFSGKHFYMYNGTGGFVGTLDGGAKTIKNITLNMPGLTDVGIFSEIASGDNAGEGGVIYGLNLENIKISAGGQWAANAGALAGSYDSWYEYNVKEIAIKDCEINSTNTRYGGIIGYVTDYARISDLLVKNVKLTGYDTSSSGPALGEYRWSYTAIVENADLRGTSYSTLEDPSYKDDLSYYSGKIETRLDGDQNNTGYYFGYDKNKHGIYVIPLVENNGWELINSETPLTSQKWIYWREDGTRIMGPGFYTLKDFSNNDQVYYFENGIAAVGLKNIGGDTYYFSEADAAPTNDFVDANMVHDQTLTIGNHTYTFGSDGKCTNCN